MTNYVYYEGPNPRYVTRPHTWDFWNTMVQQIVESSSFKRKAKPDGPKLMILNPELVPVQTEIIKDKDFLINGVNNAATIQSLTELTHLPIAELERRMLEDSRDMDEPVEDGYYGSTMGGFIQPEENLLEIMSRDNELVAFFGLTSQELAKPMFQILNAFISSGYSCRETLYFNLNRRRYSCLVTKFPMSQDCPFNDGIRVECYDFHLRKLGSKEKPRELDLFTDFPEHDPIVFSFPSLLPILIHRYGFYEGQVDFRSDPLDIMNFFGIEARR